MRFMVELTGNYAGGDIQQTFAELALEYDNGQNVITNEWPEPQSKLLPLNANGSLERASIPQVQRTGVDQFITALTRTTKQNETGDNQNIPSLAIDLWSVQYMNGTTYTGQNIGFGTQAAANAWLPAGNLMHTATGQKIVAHGSTAIPYAPTLVPSVGAGSLLPKKYVYFITCVMYDEAGNAWRSPSSIEITADLTATANNTVTVTAYLTPFENATRRRTVEFWRTDGNGATFKLLHTVTDIIANTVTVVFVDTTGDADPGEPYPADLPATLTPAFLHVATWGDRMWGVERDFPTRVWFSKPLTFGTLPEFPGEFVIDLDDAYGPITGLVAMDDKIVAFKERAIYVSGGEGPDNTGNGQFPQFTRISSDTGMIAGSPFAATGSEIYFVSLGGIWRVSSGQQVDFAGAAIDLYLSMPLLESPETVIGMVVSPGRNEVRIQTTNYRFVHDQIFDCWIRDTGGMVADAGILLTRMLGGETQAMITSQGELWREADDSDAPDDAGVTYQGTVRTAWIRPNGYEGWMRLFQARVLGECTATATTEAPTITVFYDNDDSLFESFQPQEPVANTTGPINAIAQVRRQKCSSFSLQIALPRQNATVRLDAWSATVTALPGAITRPVRKKWITVPPVVPAPPSDQMLFWFSADVGVTKDGADLVSAQTDRGPNGWDIVGSGTMLNRPTWVPNVMNGLPGLLGGPGATVGSMGYNDPRGGAATPHRPTQDGAPRMVFALVKQHATAPTNGPGGIICAFRNSAEDLEFGLWTNGGRQMVVNNTGQWFDVAPPIVNYEDQDLVISWTWRGATAATPISVDINGVSLTGAAAPSPIANDTGNNGFHIGGAGAFGDGRPYAGYIVEVIAYLGTNPITKKAALAYLNERAGL
jgi:hypothetical protein